MNPLRQASVSCGHVGELGDNDQTLILDGAGEEAGSGNVDQVAMECVLREL